MSRIIVTTHPFGCPNPKPREQLKGYSVTYNEVRRKYTRSELLEVLKKEQPEIIIAGTEKYNTEALDLVPNLQLISRVGIGLDSIPLEECVKRNIRVAFTPDAPSNAVAELTIGQMFNALRHIADVDNHLRFNGWNRYIGRELRSLDVGIIGFGRIGNLVAEKLTGLKPRRVFINDIEQGKCIGVPRCEYETKLQILCQADIITVHIPYNEANHHFISESDFNLMKKDAVLINTSRGGIVDENALYAWLETNPEAFGVVDVYTEEPYRGKLRDLANTSLTPHLASCTCKSRLMMEVGATEEVINFIKNKPFINQVV